MKATIHKISLILWGLGSVGLNQSSLACKLCEDGAKDAAKVMEQAQKNPSVASNLPSNNANFLAQRGQGASGAAGAGAQIRGLAGAQIRGLAGAGQASPKLIDGYLDGVGRGNDSPAPSSRGRGARQDSSESLYINIDYPIGDDSSQE